MSFADSIAFFIIILFSFVTLTRGSLTSSSHKFISLAAYFTGLGLLSTNIAVCTGCKILSNSFAFARLSSFLDIKFFWNSEQSFGAIFAVTLIVPTPPLLLNSNALSSFPVN